MNDRQVKLYKQLPDGSPEFVACKDYVRTTQAHELQIVQDFVNDYGVNPAMVMIIDKENGEVLYKMNFE